LSNDDLYEFGTASFEWSEHLLPKSEALA